VRRWRLDVDELLPPWAVALGIVGVVVLAVRVWSYLHRAGLPDFDLYYVGGLAERAGSYTDTARILRLIPRVAPHATHDEVYGSPVLVGLVFQPLSFLAIGTARAMWLVAGVVALAAGIRHAAGRWWPVWLAAVALATGTDLGLQLGQASLFTFALLAAAYGELRRGRDVNAGAFLAVATALKLYPGFLLVAFIAHRRWRGVASFAIVLLVAAALAMVALGPGDAVRATRAAIRLAGNIHPGPNNQSVAGAVIRATRSTALARTTASALTLAAAALVLIRPRRTAAATFAWAIPLMLLSQSISWEHYVPAALLALVAGAEAGFDRVGWVVAGAAYALLAVWVPYDEWSLSGAASLAMAPRTVALVVVAAVAGAATGRRGARATTANA
jgi:alpha-1,2-mannosyltransferase